ncbi:MAG: Chromatin structure remodeling complex protein sfh1 [Vezdaea acicularis]|nr:MAG: Chromatin structure remodeling complex protein sfh1 [Vezdaea acicularis]
MGPPQAFLSSYAPRLRTYGNALLTPVIQPTTQVVPSSRTTKRGTTAVNYADDFDDDDFEDGESRRRPTGLRSLRREDLAEDRTSAADKIGKELDAPVEVQGIWRDYMGIAKEGKYVINGQIQVVLALIRVSLFRTDRQLHAQTTLPLTLIPIRIDLDIPSFIPSAPFPLPPNVHELNLNPSLPVYKTGEATPPYRLKDVFLWNLHETLITPDQFALALVNDLDLPNSTVMAINISNQIRTQLEEYAGVALHPLFHSSQSMAGNGSIAKPTRSLLSREASAAATPGPLNASTPLSNNLHHPNGDASPLKAANGVTASAATISLSASEDLNPDDAYRCIITLNINLLNQLYTDKFEWSLLHPPGLAETFAKHTCADLGLAGEWVPSITHAIYEAVLRLKKEACEAGGLFGGNMYGGEIENQAADGKEAGWRFDMEQLADEWEPKVEILSKEEIEKREGDRERQIRRMRRETARFSTNTTVQGATPGGYFDQAPESETPMGRGERSKKRRRFRSLSPTGRAGSPGGRGTPDQGVAGYGGQGGSLTEWYIEALA